MSIYTIIIIALSLSMDAFSLALIYGTQGISKSDKLLLSIIVGTYHFIMPLIGLIIGNIIVKKMILNTSLLVGIILCIIAIEMIISSVKSKEEKFLLSISGYLLFGLSVSLDSLTIGLGLPFITDKYLMSCVLFAVISFLATIIGLNIGNILKIKYGKISTLIGGILLLILGITYILK